MPIIEGTGISGLTVAGAPVAGTDEVQTITITGTPTGGSFRLRYGGFVSAEIAYNAAAAAIDTAIEALPGFGSGAVTCAGGALPGTPVTVTFSGPGHARRPQPMLEAVQVSFSGGTAPAIAITETTPGVQETGIGAPKGALLTDTDNGILYINTGTADNPIWTKVGLQT
jgi:hypothetical protein